MITVKMDVNNPWLGVEELAATWNVTEATVRSLIKSGELKAFRIGRQYKVTPEDLQDYLNSIVTTEKENKNGN